MSDTLTLIPNGVRPLACTALHSPLSDGTDHDDRALSCAKAVRIRPCPVHVECSICRGLEPREPHAALIADILDAVHGGAPAPSAEPSERLSRTELRVLRYLPTNLTRPEIARELSVSLNTVNTHIRHIYAKLGASDRSTAVQRGRELRLLSAGRT